MRQHLPIPHMNRDDIDRLWAKVIVGSETDCWPWTGCKRGGYPAYHPPRPARHIADRLWVRYGALGNPCTLIEIDRGYCENIAEENGLKCNKEDWSCSS